MLKLILRLALMVKTPVWPVAKSIPPPKSVMFVATDGGTAPKLPSLLIDKVAALIVVLPV